MMNSFHKYAPPPYPASCDAPAGMGRESVQLIPDGFQNALPDPSGVFYLLDERDARKVREYRAWVLDWIADELVFESSFAGMEKGKIS